MSIPRKISKNLNHTFGIKSTLLNSAKYKDPSESKNGSETDSQIKSIIQHTDNLREGLERKIIRKLEMDKQRMKHTRTPVMGTISGTKTSELRSQSVLANKAIVEMGENIEYY